MPSGGNAGDLRTPNESLVRGGLFRDRLSPWSSRWVVNWMRYTVTHRLTESTQHIVLAGLLLQVLLVLGALLAFWLDVENEAGEHAARWSKGRPRLGDVCGLSYAPMSHRLGAVNFRTNMRWDERERAGHRRRQQSTSSGHAPENIQALDRCAGVKSRPCCRGSMNRTQAFFLKCCPDCDRSSFFCPRGKPKCPQCDANQLE